MNLGIRLVVLGLVCICAAACSSESSNVPSEDAPLHNDGAVDTDIADDVYIDPVGDVDGGDEGSVNDGGFSCTQPLEGSLTACLQNPLRCESMQDAKCDDGNACTVDLCVRAAGCVSVARDCHDGDACTRDSCVADVGCTFEAVDCGVDTACLDAWCDAALGCVYAPVVCDDSDGCTADLCDAATERCRFEAKACEDGVACTLDSCVEGACTHTPTDALCPEGTACRTSVCTAEGCIEEPKSGPCDDGDACTSMSECVQGVCVGEGEVACNDGDPCTVDSCEANLGCINAPFACDDGDLCTVDTCASDGACTYSVDRCDDANACTLDTCDSAGGCIHKGILCTDEDPCTVDGCNAVQGCDFTTSACDDGNACTTDLCSGNIECAHVAVDCNDGSVCTKDSCDPVIGCVHPLNTQLPCNVNPSINPCGEGIFCHPILGCVSYEIDCESDDPCMIAEKIRGCCQVFPRPCTDGDPCTVDGCEPGKGCINVSKYQQDCDDFNTVTLDQCVPFVGCVSEPFGELYYEAVGNVGDEVVVPMRLVNPNDDEPLVAIQFDLRYDNKLLKFLQAEDLFVPFPGGPEIVITLPPNVLFPTGHAVFVVNQNGIGRLGVGAYKLSNFEPVTDAFLVNGEIVGDPVFMWARFELLVHAPPEVPVPIYADNLHGSNEDALEVPYIKVEAGTLVPYTKVECVTDQDCDDQNLCTKDRCETLIPNVDSWCTNEGTGSELVDWTVIQANDGCVDWVCDPTAGILYPPKDCDDKNACTIDSCEQYKCINTPVSLDDGDSCTVDYCDIDEGVFHVPANCFDSLNCTADFCVQNVGCVNAFACGDKFPCTHDVCEKDVCKNLLIHENCDDQNPNTDDYCAPELPNADLDGCIFVPN